MTESLILFRITWDTRMLDGSFRHEEEIVDSLSRVGTLLIGLHSNIERYSNVKTYAAKVDWIET